MVAPLRPDEASWAAADPLDCGALDAAAFAASAASAGAGMGGGGSFRPRMGSLDVARGVTRGSPDSGSPRSLYTRVAPPPPPHTPPGGHRPVPHAREQLPTLGSTHNRACLKAHATSLAREHLRHAWAPLCVARFADVARAFPSRTLRRSADRSDRGAAQGESGSFSAQRRRSSSGSSDAATGAGSQRDALAGAPTRSSPGASGGGSGARSHPQAASSGRASKPDDSSSDEDSSSAVASRPRIVVRIRGPADGANGSGATAQQPALPLKPFGLPKPGSLLPPPLLPPRGGSTLLGPPGAAVAPPIVRPPPGLDTSSAGSPSASSSPTGSVPSPALPQPQPPQLPPHAPQAAAADWAAF